MWCSALTGYIKGEVPFGKFHVILDPTDIDSDRVWQWYCLFSFCHIHKSQKLDLRMHHCINLHHLCDTFTQLHSEWNLSNLDTNEAEES